MPKDLYDFFCSNYIRKITEKYIDIVELEAYKLDQNEVRETKKMNKIMEALELLDISEKGLLVELPEEPPGLILCALFYFELRKRKDIIDIRELVDSEREDDKNFEKFREYTVYKGVFGEIYISK